HSGLGTGMGRRDARTTHRKQVRTAGTSRPNSSNLLSDCEPRRVLCSVGTVPETEDLTSEALLARFATTSAEEFFAELVQRHLAMVYRTALRLTRGNTHLAEDVGQIVFADLARKAGCISSDTL